VTVDEDDSLKLFPNQTLPGWVSVPFRDFLDDIKELDTVLHLAMGGIRTHTGMPHVHELLNRVKGGDPDDSEYKAELAHVKELAEFAQTEIDREFPRLHAFAVITICASMESCFENFAAAWLANRPAALRLDAVMKVKVSLADYEGMAEKERFLYLVDQIERDLSIPFKDGATRFEDLLSVFGLGGEVDGTVKRDIFELTKVRNVLAHRRGVADSRFCKACPWLGLKPGEVVSIKHEAYQRYLNAAGKYVSSVILRLHRMLGEAGELEPA
jgi:hypothetical protein